MQYLCWRTIGNKMKKEAILICDNLYDLVFKYMKDMSVEELSVMVEHLTQALKKTLAELDKRQEDKNKKTIGE